MCISCSHQRKSSEIWSQKWPFVLGNMAKPAWAWHKRMTSKADIVNPYVFIPAGTRNLLQIDKCRTILRIWTTSVGSYHPVSFPFLKIASFSYNGYWKLPTFKVYSFKTVTKIKVINILLIVFFQLFILMRRMSFCLIIGEKLFGLQMAREQAKTA